MRCRPRPPDRLRHPPAARHARRAGRRGAGRLRRGHAGAVPQSAGRSRPGRRLGRREPRRGRGHRARRARCWRRSPALLGSYALPLAAFCGGLATTLVLYRVATRQGRTSVATMLLAGIALAALAMALTGILIFMADDRQLRDLTFWQLGSLAGATWEKIGVGRADHRAGAGGDAVPGARPQRAGARRSDGRPSRHPGAAAEIHRDRRRLGGGRRVGRGQRRHRLRRHRRAASAAAADRSGQPLSAAGSALLGASPAASGRCRQPAPSSRRPNCRSASSPRSPARRSSSGSCCASAAIARPVRRS